MAGVGCLSFEGVAKSFGGTQALRGVSFDVARGEIVALLGENGAGKSTLIKILGGIYEADAGQVSVDGAPYRHGAQAEAQRVAFIHQDLGLIDWMSVAENVGLARGFARSRRLGRFGVIDWAGSARVARDALAIVGCDIDPETRVQALSRTEKSLVAIARALAARCDFLVLDEPTASLPADEVERLFAAMWGLKARNVGMIYVSHRLDEIFKVADRVVVLRDGRKIAEDHVEQVTADDIVGKIVGRTTFDAFERTAWEPGALRVSVRGVTTSGAGPVHFNVHQGELVGLVGLRGAGQEEIGRALFGAFPHGGDVTIDGAKLDLSSPYAALRQGVGLMARDRTEESLAPSLSVRENAYLNPAAAQRGLFSVLSPRREAKSAAALGLSVNLRPNAPELAIEGLSGGNQQKVVVARWLATRRRLLIAEDPTAGVDIGAKAEIYGLIARALREGLAVVVISTDFEEVAHICHRALVFSRGLITRELVGPDLTIEALISAASASEAA